LIASCSSEPSAFIASEVTVETVARNPNPSIVKGPSTEITSTSIKDSYHKPLEGSIEYFVRCWSGSSETGTYEIIWLEFVAPEMAKLQEILDRDAVAAFDQYNSWEGVGNSLSFETQINFANKGLVSVTSKTSYMASGAAHPQDVQTSILWDTATATVVEPFNPDPESSAKIFIDEENFLAFYSTMSSIAAEKFMFDSWDQFNKHSPMRAVIVTPEGLTASWDRAGAVPSFELFRVWSDISGVADLVLDSLEDRAVASSREKCVPAWSDETG
jgi:hypothetical protein